MRVLLVEDSVEVAEVISEYFEGTDIELDYAGTGPQGLWLAQNESFDCIVLDIMLPGMDGISVCKQLRSLGHDTPIVMLTARDTNEDILVGLRQGADDYIVKPFDLELLEARIHAVVRRVLPNRFKTMLQLGPLRIDLNARQVFREDREIRLNPSCYKILKLLVEKMPGGASREDIEHLLWSDDPPLDDVLRKHIYHLRAKVDKPFAFPMIQTIPKYGYKLVVPDA